MDKIIYTVVDPKGEVVFASYSKYQAQAYFNKNKTYKLVPTVVDTSAERVKILAKLTPVERVVLQIDPEPVKPRDGGLW